ncbi:hypothetical protein HZB01_03865 [Candidatus Woesearchaeota archaeon]|nr:hypothetical protein [Candidatus Woesearchaeota archaeon]
MNPIPTPPTKVLIATVIKDEIWGPLQTLLEEQGILVDRLPKGLAELDGLGSEDLCKRLAGFQVIIIRSDKVNRRIIDAAADTGLFIRAGVGTDTIDTTYATKMNKLVENTPGRNANAVAELVFAHLFNIYRHVHHADRTTRDGFFLKSKYVGREIMGKRLAILGLGSIGILVAQKAKGLGMEVGAYDPYQRDEVFQTQEVKRLSLEECFTYDVVTLHMNLTDETRGIVTEELLCRMPLGGALINAARAEVVDREGLCCALEKRKDLRCAFDVFHEGDLPKEQEAVPLVKEIIRRFPQQVASVTPHLGASTLEANEHALAGAGEQALRYLKEGAILNAVNYVHISKEGQGFMDLAKSAGSFAAGLMDGGIPDALEITFAGTIKERDYLPISGSVITGMLQAWHETITPVNAKMFAEERGVKISIAHDPHLGSYANQIGIMFRKQEASCYIEASLFGNTGHLTQMLGIPLLYNPCGNHLVIKHSNVPGVIALVADYLAANRINVESLVNTGVNGTALSLYNLSRKLSEEEVKHIHQSLQNKGVHLCRSFGV